MLVPEMDLADALSKGGFQRFRVGAKITPSPKSLVVPCLLLACLASPTLEDVLVHRILRELSPGPVSDIPGYWLGQARPPRRVLDCKSCEYTKDLDLATFVFIGLQGLCKALRLAFGAGCSEET